MKFFKTYSKKAGEVEHKWVVIDAAGVPVGRLATFAANRLTGKYSPEFTSHMDAGDHVIVINAEKAVLTGNKEEDKKYYHHTGFPGGIKEATAKDLRAKDATKIIKLAVHGMLPKNKTQSVREARLHVFVGETHDHNAQQPVELKVKAGK